MSSSRARARRSSSDERCARQLVAIVDRAVKALLEMRAAEGARLVTYLEERLANIELALGAHVAGKSALQAAWWSSATGCGTPCAGADGTDVGAWTNRGWRREIALGSLDRLDVQEEASALQRPHRGLPRAAHRVGCSLDGVGKRLGFLLQEMLREANTTGSKGNDAAIVADRPAGQGEELERIREQVENLE